MKTGGSNFVLVLLLCVTLFGCQRETRVEEIEAGIYVITGQSFLNSGSKLSTLADTIEESEEFCMTSFKKKPLVKKISYYKLRPQSTSVFVKIIFKCLDEGDSELEDGKTSKVLVEDYTDQFRNPFSHLFRQNKQAY